MSSTDASAIDVTLNDGSVARYSMRGLTESEIQTWAEFCASVFSYKNCPPPSSYFERHFYNDPDRDASLVRVMLYNGTIVSSCRIFQRRISTLAGQQGDNDGDGASTPVLLATPAGGIGEVCTDAQHRKRGLSKLLLQNAIDIMTNRGMKLSLLHAAPAFVPVYEKSGEYQCVMTRWSVVTVITSKLKEALHPFSIRLAQFPKDTSQLQKIHEQYSEGRFLGCICRSEAYWNDYIRLELDGTLWTLVQHDRDQVTAWLSLRPRAGRCQMRDFGCDIDSVSVSEALAMLLKVALPDQGDCGEQVSLCLPTSIVEDATSRQTAFLDVGTASAENDNGWMHKALQPGLESVVDASKTCDHLIWPADSF